MIMTAAPRYSPNRSAKLEPAILAALDDRWVNTATVCKAIGRWCDDGATRYALKRLANRGVIERARGGRRGITFLYRRKP